MPHNRKGPADAPLVVGDRVALGFIFGMKILAVASICGVLTVVALVPPWS